ncbi:hypothetical protein L1049_006464 [Liquidambar formosana]|uniref:SET domain-containing protein n=1 Tax=Liquidambar formosana TaxID=63359 RepID=A0AAP0WTS5_LIQFO
MDRERSGMSGLESRLPFLRRVEIEGKGRALVASQSLGAGQIVLRDSPILLYSALPFVKNKNNDNPSSNNSYCSNCFRTLQQSSVSCPSCSPHHAALFCSPNCQSSSVAHSPWVCQALSRLRDCPSLLLHEDRQVQASFLIAAYNLALVSPSHFQILLSLQGEAEASPPPPEAHFLHSIISSLCPPQGISGFSLQLTASLLAKDKFNAFALMEPFAQDGYRSVRAYGIYPNASFFNHDCLPNACRFDYVDTESDCNTDIIVRLIHDVPQGREICLSYFPVNQNYSSRQRRLMEDYGFACQCDRCKVEANWSDEDDEEEEVMDEEGDQDEPMAVEDSDTDFPHAYFFLRYMCNRENCWGTLAPLPPSNGSPSNVLECNVCGNLKKEDDEVDGDSGEEVLLMDD